MKKIFIVILFFLLLGCGTHEEIITYPLLSLYNNSQIYGDFFLGIGTIEEREYYFGFIKTDKGIRRLKVSTQNTFIIETEEFPKIKFKIKYDDMVGYPSDYKIMAQLECGCRKTELYVPYNTIITKFELK